MLTKELMYIMSMPGGLLEPLQQCDIKSMPYPQWLQQWLSHLIPTSLFSKTPLQASHIHTPLIHAAWLHHLRHHPHQDQVQYFLQCISTGFRVRFDGSSTQSAKNNLQSTVAYPTVVDDYIHHEQDKWWLITDLSYPSGSSVNDGMPSQLCSLTYLTIDDAILNILKSWKNNTGKDWHQKDLSFITSAPNRPISTRDDMERSDIHWSLYSLWTLICTQTILPSCWSSSMDCSEWRCFLPYSLFGWLPNNGTTCLHSVPTQRRHTCILMCWIRGTYCNWQTGGPFNITILLRHYFGH